MMITRTEADTRDLLRDLSATQREAVTHTNGPLLILAGPGSGKTRVVTRRAAHLARTVTDPYHILAVTFTNKAAREMRERIEQLGVGHGMTVSTFHALGARLLRQYHDRAGVSADFTIFDTDDRRKLIKQAVAKCDLSTDNWSPAMLEREISLAKSAMETVQRFAEGEMDWRRRSIARVYETYEQMLAEQNGLDFDDLLLRPALMLDEDAELRDQLEDRFRYVLIDEYQDTNAAQYAIARLLTKTNRNLCATGDPDQSIYGWRGADISNILGFERDYPDTGIIRLEQNYRSTQRIVAAADALIAGNQQRKAKSLWTERGEGDKIRIIEVETGDDEARWVVADVQRRIAAGAKASDVALFYRVNSLSRSLEEAMMRGGVAYQIARGVEFYKRKEIKDVLAYLRVLVNPSDDTALARVINTPPRGIGATTVKRLWDHAANTAQRPHAIITGDTDLSFLGRSADRVKQFGKTLRELAHALEWSASKAIEHIVSHSGLHAHYLPTRDAEGSALGNIEELISAAAEFQETRPDATVRDWIEHTALVSDVDAVQSGSGAVTLMTLHAAKGLEFPIVYMIGLEDGLLPMRRDDEPKCDEEERRLCFVGITRAQTHLTMTRARYRTMHGATRRTVQSPFLDELPDSVLEWSREQTTRQTHHRHHAHREVERSAANGLPADIGEWEVGTLVRHPTHGLGRIMSMQRGARRTHVDVQFRNGPRKSWVLEFADLARVDFDEME